MKYTLEYPIELPTAPDDFLQPEVIRAVVDHGGATGGCRSSPRRVWQRRCAPQPSRMPISSVLPCGACIIAWQTPDATRAPSTSRWCARRSISTTAHRLITHAACWPNSPPRGHLGSGARGRHQPASRGRLHQGVRQRDGSCCRSEHLGVTFVALWRPTAQILATALQTRAAPDYEPLNFNNVLVRCRLVICHVPSRFS